MTDTPTPNTTADSRPYFEGCRAGELCVQVCAACTCPQFPPSPRCRVCGAGELAWKATNGLGTIHSITIVHRAPTAAFRNDCPYGLALIDLDEGVRLMLNVRGANATHGKIGDRVRVTFEERSSVLTIPQCELI